MYVFMYVCMFVSDHPADCLAVGRKKSEVKINKNQLEDNENQNRNCKFSSINKSSLKNV